MREHHYRNLDSLRGLAALSVVFNHVSYATSYEWLLKTPWRYLATGQEPVILFFVLSGFVLSLQLERAKIPYIQYALRRICRIYLPYLAVIFIGLASLALIPARSIAWAGPWWASYWQTLPDIRQLAYHVLLILPFHTGAIVPIIWTLIYEMRISFLMPMIYLANSRFGWKICLLFAFLLTGLSLIGEHKATLSLLDESYVGSWSMTLHYAAMFVVGSILATQRRKILAFFSAHKLANIVGVLGLVFYFEAGDIAAKLHHEGFLGDWIIALGSSGIITSSLIPSIVSKCTELSFSRLLGKISYSLYLIHMVVFLSAFHFLTGITPNIWIIPIALVSVIPCALLCYYCIEQPSIRLSRRFTATKRFVQKSSSGLGARGA